MQQTICTYPIMHLDWRPIYGYFNSVMSVCDFAVWKVKVGLPVYLLPFNVHYEICANDPLYSKHKDNDSKVKVSRIHRILRRRPSYAETKWRCSSSAILFLQDWGTKGTQASSNRMRCFHSIAKNMPLGEQI